MSWEQTVELAELITMHMENGDQTWAMRLWERALQDGADFDKLENAIFEARYGTGEWQRIA